MMGVLPVLALVLLALWQVGLLGYTYLIAGHAAREGARELAVNTLDTKKDKPYRDAAEEDLPKAWRKDAKIEIDKDDPVTVNVRLNVPVVLPGLKQRVQGLRPRLDVGRGRAAARLAGADPAARQEGQGLMRARLADQAGQASAEVMGMIFWLLLVTVDHVAGLPRRVDLHAGLERGAHRQPRRRPRRRPEEGRARTRSPTPLQKTIEKIKIDGDKATVTVRMPLLIPGLLTSDQLTATRSAELPS